MPPDESVRLEERLENVEREVDRLGMMLAGKNGRVRSYYELNDVVGNLATLVYGDPERGIDQDDSLLRIVRRLDAKDRRNEAYMRGIMAGLGLTLSGVAALVVRIFGVLGGGP